MSYKDLYSEAEEILKEPPEIERLSDGKYIVMYMNFNSKPPPVGDTPEEALSKFLMWYKEGWLGLDKQPKGVEDET